MKVIFARNPLNSQLSICIFVTEKKLAQSIAELLSGDRYKLNMVESPGELVKFIEEHKEQVDCLIVLLEKALLPLLHLLYEQGTLLPAIVIIDRQGESLLQNDLNRSEEIENDGKHIYHSGEVKLLSTELEEIASSIDSAIGKFLHLGPSCSIAEKSTTLSEPQKLETKQNFLMLQQRRLAEKLKERLGYLGVYYKRNPKSFYRNLNQEEKKELLEQLNLEYREIILNYFGDDAATNQAIDQFINRAFFADISVSQILEMHMALMGEFAKQLKLEGRSEEILLDYRLALIDLIAHLCEMYRRSIPREDIPYDLLFQID